MTDNPFVNITVYIEKDADDKVYDVLVRRGVKGIEDYPFETKKDLFMVAACIGAKLDKYEDKFIKKHGPFSGETFNSKIDVPILMALAYKKTKDVDILLEPTKVIEIAQGWANGGISLVYDYILNTPGRPLFNYVAWVLDQVEPRP